ncbi:hypothetical protein GA0061105_105413 [Rhizobium aethiopicum]|uniref:GAD-related domain-containing protein n=1 Tax=Rhizobium aethiopicum TaxID=1138170 RepID=A0A1C3Y3C6_9HYPH|nr:GAD-like domain-containing protein [Rhizobium aethiopicum]SCB58941.1 hypothetical protein GA0061105_105413 [Rhizobium aethiopicum]
MEQYREKLEAVIAKFTAAGAEKGHGGAADPRKYEGRLPTSVFQLWERLGFGVFLDGYFQLCDPDTYRPILDQALGRDSDLEPSRTHPVGFSAFGEIIAWNEDHRDVRVNLVDGQVSCRWLFAPKSGIDPNITLLTRLLLADDASFDPLDAKGKPLFKSARSRLGKVGPGHMYGFKPILAFGGNRTAASLVACEALPHMSILAQAQNLKLMGMNSYPPRVVRTIG